jgi:hypothetical protein
MQYQEYQDRIRIRERIDRELPRINFNLRDAITDLFDEKEIRLVNSKQWIDDIWELYSETRWSIMEAFSYLELDYQLAFLYYSDNAIFRLYAVREKIAQLINDYYNLGMKSTEVGFEKLINEHRTEIDADILKVLHRLKGNAHFNNLIENFRHPKTHREEPYIEEKDNYRFIMKKVSANRVDFIAEKGNIEWNISMIKDHLLKSFEAIIDFIVNVFRFLFKGQAMII